MKESHKVVLEQGQQDSYKRIIIEQGTEADPTSQTPQWDSMKVRLKENTAEKGTLFVSSFVQSIKPALVVGMVILILIALKVC